MGKHIVRVVDDNTLSASCGWVMAQDANGDLYFVVERSAAADEEVLTAAWDAARRLEDDNDAMRQAVTRGHRDSPRPNVNGAPT